MTDANSAWLRLLAKLLDSGDLVAPRGVPCLELLAHTTEVDMLRPVVTVADRKLGRRFLCAEAWWILSGRNDVASIAPYSKTIANFSDDGRRFDGAYGVKVVEQLRYACDCLVADNDTRQAVISVWRENPRPSKDVPCTLSYQFLIRRSDDGSRRRMHCVATMRSSDAWLGIVYDWFNISMLSAYILLTIRQRCRDLNDVGLGSLRLTAGSQHLYESNKDQAWAVLKNQPMTRADKYSPLDVDEFRSPDNLLLHLEGLKDKKNYTGYGWLTDLIESTPSCYAPTFNENAFTLTWPSIGNEP
jgi:thymidylate synthase